MAQAKPKDHTKAIETIKKTVADLKKNVNGVTKAQEKAVAEKGAEVSPEEHQAALSHFAQQYKLAKMNKDEKAAAEHSKSYHEYAAKMTKHFHTKLKESADFCPECQEDPCVCGGNHLEEETNPYLKEENQIDEISKELANRYMHSAFADRKRTDDKMMDLQNKQSTGDKFFRSHKKISKLLAKSDRRTTGISRALNRITKEEVEQVDELKKSTLASYVNKAADSAAMSAYGAGGESQRYASEPVSKRPDSYGSDRKAALKRLKGIAKATKRLAKEEVEDVSELNTSTLSSYLEKKHKRASDLPVKTYDRQKGMIHKDPTTGKEMSADEAGSKISKHLSNIAKAQEKIRKNVNKSIKPSKVDYSADIQKDYEKNRGRYQGD